MPTTFVTAFSGLSEDEKENQVQMVVCMLVKDLPDPYIPSHKEECAGCHKPVWVAEIFPKKPLKYCMPCAMLVAEGDEATRQ